MFLNGGEGDEEGMSIIVLHHTKNIVYSGTCVQSHSSWTPVELVLF